MTAAPPTLTPPARNIALYPWFKALMSLNFWQAVWFLYFQSHLSAAEAVLLYAIYDVATTLLEVPSGYASDRLGRRVTLILSAGCGALGAAFLYLGDGFAMIALGQCLIGASAAFASGTDSALLYESLEAEGRSAEVERQEIRAWRFSFAAYALAALTGGLMAMVGPALPFAGGILTFGAATLVAWRFAEPPRRHPGLPEGAEILHPGGLRQAFRQPVVRWLFALAVAMYAFSHVPFVFGQPFILSALDGLGLGAQAPGVSGAVSAAMMAVSLGVSAFAPGLRRGLGLPGILLLSFGLQIALCAVMALTNGPWAICLLMLRMVPVALSRPFRVARLQPLLDRDSRATYFSLESFAGRIAFAASLWLASTSASGVGAMPYTEIRLVLTGYVIAGLAVIATLALTAARARVEATAAIP
ncbi:MFS transporter [Acidimangrovimonas sediminis]|uniref:MFS transporter n=1 Tax=Acidimangrovimonas sediminis TaxID=2056283 RepID=UPI000C8021F2|nr:MFS transporter [Acidimangrovimonas sediminis]